MLTLPTVMRVNPPPVGDNRICRVPDTARSGRAGDKDARCEHHPALAGQRIDSVQPIRDEIRERAEALFASLR